MRAVSASDIHDPSPFVSAQGPLESGKQGQRVHAKVVAPRSRVRDVVIPQLDHQTGPARFHLSHAAAVEELKVKDRSISRTCSDVQQPCTEHCVRHPGAIGCPVETPGEAAYSKGDGCCGFLIKQQCGLAV